MEIVDFGVAIEEVMDRECSDYECLVHDDDDVGYLWSFVIEDSISGFVGIEDNKETFDVDTVTVGLHLKDVTDHSRDQLIDILEMNTQMFNASFGITRFPASMPEGIDDFDDGMLEMIAGNVSTEREMLVIQSRMPLEVFAASDFMGYVQSLLFQAEFMMIDHEEHYDEDEPGVEMTHSDDLVDLVGSDEVGGDLDYDDDFDDDDD